MIVHALKMAGFAVTRSTATKPGDPDLWATRGDLRLAIEIKRDAKTRIGLWQAKQLVELRKKGYIADVVFGYADFESKFGKYL